MGIAQDGTGARYVDHEPGTWFLVELQGVLHLDARYTYSAVIDDSALIRLTDAELESYRSGGHDYLTTLADRIHRSAPYRDTSAYHRRDLYRGSDGTEYRRAVSAAIADHTWT
jgi:hypothetical protein